MPHPIAYLMFDGTCRDAMQFYERALDARIELMMTNGESPVAAHCAPGSEHRVLHARLQLPGGGLLYGGDCPQQMAHGGIQGVNLTLNYDTVAAAERAFAALAVGGRITMPMQATFWAKTWGMLVDKFGKPWIVNGELLPL